MVAASLTALRVTGKERREFTAYAVTDPQTGKSVLLYNPRKDFWEEHFRWSTNWQKLIGRTPTGRATVRAL